MKNSPSQQCGLHFLSFVDFKIFQPNNIIYQIHWRIFTYGVRRNNALFDRLIICSWLIVYSTFHIHVIHVNKNTCTKYFLFLCMYIVIYVYFVELVLLWDYAFSVYVHWECQIPNVSAHTWLINNNKKWFWLCINVNVMVLMGKWYNCVCMLLFEATLFSGLLSAGKCLFVVSAKKRGNEVF